MHPPSRYQNVHLRTPFLRVCVNLDVLPTGGKEHARRIVHTILKPKVLFSNLEIFQSELGPKWTIIALIAQQKRVHTELCGGTHFYHCRQTRLVCAFLYKAHERRVSTRPYRLRLNRTFTSLIYPPSLPGASVGQLLLSKLFVINETVIIRKTYQLEAMHVDEPSLTTNRRVGLNKIKCTIHRNHRLARPGRQHDHWRQDS